MLCLRSQCRDKAIAAADRGYLEVQAREARVTALVDEDDVRFLAGLDADQDVGLPVVLSKVTAQTASCVGIRIIAVSTKCH